MAARVKLDLLERSTSIQSGGSSAMTRSVDTSFVNLVDNAAVPDASTAMAHGASAVRKLHRVKIPVVETPRVEQPVNLSSLPRWGDQLTVRALFVGICLGTGFCILTHRLLMTTGESPSRSEAAGFLGFVVVKMWVKIGNKLGFKMLPFTPQENSIIVTAAVSCNGVAFTGGFATFLLGMTPKIQRLLGDSPGNIAANIMPYHISKAIAYIVLITFTGALFITCLRKIFIIDYNLAYPVGTSTGVVINSLHASVADKKGSRRQRTLAKWITASFCFSAFKWAFSYVDSASICSGGFPGWPTFGRKAYQNTWNFDFDQGIVGAGMLTPLTADWSILIGSIASWGVLTPLIKRRAGEWYPALNVNTSSIRGPSGYRSSVAIALLLGDGLYNVVKIVVLTSCYFFAHRKASSNLPQTRADLKGFVGNNLAETQTVNTARISFFMSERIPSWTWISGYLCISVLAIALLPQVFPQLGWYHVLVLETLAPAFAISNAYSVGLTNFGVSSTYAKLSTIVFALWAGQKGGVVAGLGSAGLMVSIVSGAADLMQAYRTAYLTLASAKAIFAAQLIGMVAGCFLAPATFQIFNNMHSDIGEPTSKYPAPFAQVYRAEGAVGAGHAVHLGRHCLWLALACFICAILMSAARNLLPPKLRQWVPIPTAMAVAFTIGGTLGVDMITGGIIMWTWRMLNRFDADANSDLVASGMLAGDSFWGIPSDIMQAAGVSPPMCMVFESKAAADAAAAEALYL